MLVPVIERSERVAVFETGWSKSSGEEGMRRLEGKRAGRSCLAVRERAGTRAVSCVSRGMQSGGGFRRRLKVEGKRGGYGCKRDTREEGERMAMGGARMAFCGQFSMCLYAVMCYRFPPEPCCLRAYVLHATRYSYLYSELCEINPSPRARGLSSSLLTLFFLCSVYFAPFFYFLLPLVPSHPRLLYSTSLDST